MVRAALTFDAEHPDRPGCPPGAAEGILAALEGADVRAAFFLQGRWAQANPDTSRRIAEGGHLVGSHSHFHARMSLLTDEGVRRDIAEAELAISEATGVDPRPWFRLPWGDGARDPVVLEALETSVPRIVGRLRSAGVELVGLSDLHWRDLSATGDPQTVSENPCRDAV